MKQSQKITKVRFKLNRILWGPPGHKSFHVLVSKSRCKQLLIRGVRNCRKKKRRGSQEIVWGRSRVLVPPKRNTKQCDTEIKAPTQVEDGNFRLSRSTWIPE